VAGISDVIGALPYRMAFAGGWIDQPFVSEHNPDGVGSMVVVAIHPDSRFMDRCGMGTSTRRIAARMWGDRLPDRDPMAMARELYDAENAGQPEPSGSQDMLGLILPGINRLDYASNIEGGTYPAHVESCNDRDVADWLEQRIWMVPVAQRPPGYNPLGIRTLDPAWIRRLGQSGKDCYDAIVRMDAASLGASMNECMACWEAILPHAVSHPTITIDLMAILKHYQDAYPGAMYSGCGGGYLYVVSGAPVPGGFRVRVRTA